MMMALRKFGIVCIGMLCLVTKVLRAAKRLGEWVQSCSHSSDSGRRPIELTYRHVVGTLTRGAW